MRLLSVSQRSLLLFLSTYFLVTATVVVGADTSYNAQSYASGKNWAMQSMKVLTGGHAVEGVSLSGSVTWIKGKEQGTGTISLQATGMTNSQVQLSTNQGNRTEIRSWASDGSGPVGQWVDGDGKSHAMVQHNCWSDAAWFFPALSMLSDYSDPSLVFNDLGQEQRDGRTVEHIQAFRPVPGLPSADLVRLSRVDYYLDSRTAVPIAIAFDVHGDNNVGANIPVEITFSGYKAVDGILTPLQITKAFNGAPQYQITISSVELSGQASPTRFP